MTDIAKFFEALSWRAYKENDLSDVTYAMCEADAVFKQFFINFFFEDQKLNADECTIEREVVYTGFSSRPDIVFRKRNKDTFFVEVKIWDSNHHFEQYAKVLKEVEKIDEVEKHFGYIAAYKINEDQLNDENDKVVFRAMNKLSRVKTWKDLCDKLERCNYCNDEKIAAYVKYCRNLCAVDDLYPSLLKSYGEKTISDILEELDEVRKSDSNILTEIKKNPIREYNQAKYFNPTRWMGHHFSFSSKGDNDNHDVWAWIGVWLKWGAGDKSCCQPCIVLRDCEGWGKIVCDKLRENKGLVPYVEEDGKLFLPLKKSSFQKPRNVLSTFIEWVRSSDVSLQDIIFSGNESDPFEPAKMFYLIPMFIRNELTGEYSKEGTKYSVSYHYGNDAQQPQSWCGEYLSVRKAALSSENQADKKPPVFEKTCYIGFYFGDPEKKKRGLYFEVDGKSKMINDVKLNDLKKEFANCLYSMLDDEIATVE